MCVNLLILYTAQMKAKLLMESEKFWANNWKILFLNLDTNESLLASKLFYKENFRLDFGTIYWYRAFLLKFKVNDYEIQK